MEEKKEFIQWLEDNNYFLKKVIEKKNALLQWFSYIPEEAYEDICSKLYDVLSRCDEIEYNDSEAAAYVITHFLDRYYRSLLIFEKLFELDCFPEREEMKIMDIGTGPGMTLYAYADFINLLAQYKNEKNIENRINPFLDYVEYSDSFRGFLHHFTEIQMTDFEKVRVPFHNGTYKDVREFDLSGKLKYDEGWRFLFVPKSYDLVTYSNFLTNEQTVNMCYQQIKQIMFWMRNKGVLLIIGGNPESKKYIPVYKKINQAIFGQNYKTRKFDGRCLKITGETGLCMSYQRNDPVNLTIADFHRKVLNQLTNNDLTKIDKRYMQVLKSELSGNGEETWWISIYMKRSRYRKGT